MLPVCRGLLASTRSFPVAQLQRSRARAFGDVTRPSTLERTQVVHVCNDKPDHRNQADLNIIAIVHAIIAVIAIGYAQNYYFHLRKLQIPKPHCNWTTTDSLQVTTRTTPTRCIPSLLYGRTPWAMGLGVVVNIRESILAWEWMCERRKCMLQIDSICSRTTCITGVRGDIVCVKTMLYSDRTCFEVCLIVYCPHQAHHIDDTGAKMLLPE